MHLSMGIVLLIAGGMVLTMGDIIMKQWIATDRHTFFLLGLSIYLVGLVFLAMSYRYKNIAVSSAMIVIINVTTLSFVSWLVFKEPLSVNQMFGVALALGGIILIESK
jgi:multidrug transporter EmrE-like cation transporter